MKRLLAVCVLALSLIAGGSPAWACNGDAPGFCPDGPWSSNCNWFDC